MYDFFRGTLAEKNPLYAVIDISGIGYKLHIAARHYLKLPEVGKTLLLYAAWVVRENSHTLFGFLEKEERSLFEQLLTLSGVGPKTALSLIGHFAQGELEKIVYHEDSHALAQVPGIGKKTAEKLLVDLRGRLKIPTAPKGMVPMHRQDALSALLHLGCTPAQAEQAVYRALEELPEEVDLSILIATALKLKK